jgi:hypothetical protein
MAMVAEEERRMISKRTKDALAAAKRRDYDLSLKQCEAYLNECQALAAEAKLSLRRATAVMAVCHAWLALRDAVRKYETIAGEEDAAQAH